MHLIFSNVYSGKSQGLQNDTFPLLNFHELKPTGFCLLK